MAAGDGGCRCYFGNRAGFVFTTGSMRNHCRRPSLDRLLSESGCQGGSMAPPFFGKSVNTWTSLFMDGTAVIFF